MVNQHTGAAVPVKSYRWSCRSCGLDKRRRLAEMVVQAAEESGGHYSYVVLTHRPIDVADGEDPSEAEAPAGFTGCDPLTHVMRSKAGVLQWRRMLDCRNCIAEDTRLLVLWRKRFRRRWPNAQMLITREEHPGEWSLGVIHNNVIITGLPFTIRGKSRAERLVKEHWYAVGGGHARASTSKKGNAEAVGRYVGKYVTKATISARIARHARIWRRTAGFARSLQMVGYRPATEPNWDTETGELIPSPWVMSGWWDDYLDREVQRLRSA